MLANGFKPVVEVEKPDYPYILTYEDEGDNYNYEKGVYSTISITWKESTHTLTIGERKGTYPGMLEERSFTIITPDGKKQEIQYTGKAVACNL